MCFENQIDLSTHTLLHEHRYSSQVHLGIGRVLRPCLPQFFYCLKALSDCLSDPQYTGLHSKALQLGDVRGVKVFNIEESI